MLVKDLMRILLNFDEDSKVLIQYEDVWGTNKTSINSVEHYDDGGTTLIIGEDYE